MGISFIYVNFNTAEHIIKSIQSLLKLNIDFEYEIIIIDNNSSDLHILNEIADSAHVKKIFTKENTGFGRACNVGAEQSKFQYLLFVNPDIIFRDNPFPALIDFILENSNAGAIGGILLNDDGSFQYSYNSFPNFEWEISELFGSTNNLIEKKLSKIQNNKALQVDWLIGAFMFMKKNVFLKAGGFDDDYFLYYEDTDLQKKINDFGHKNYLLPGIKLIHGTKSSIKGESGNKVYNREMNKSKMIYLYKHSGFVKRNFIRIINIIRILSRVFILPLKLLMKKTGSEEFKILISNLKIYLQMQKYFFNGR